ncbi:MAG: hypothetical protein JO187_04455 [Acidobacteria bacterium]|nr:hypothetical protein [Acidobacteriota bacterium]
MKNPLIEYRIQVERSQLPALVAFCVVELLGVGSAFPAITDAQGDCVDYVRGSFPFSGLSLVSSGGSDTLRLR